VEQYIAFCDFVGPFFQDMKLEDLDTKSAHGFESRNKNQQWLQSDFITFSKERDVHLASVAYAHLDVSDFLKLFTS
jgi:hypothetical protein